MSEYEDFQSAVPYNTNHQDIEFSDTIFTHKENFALAQAAFYAAIGEFRNAHVIMHNEENFSSKEHKQIAWLVLSSALRKIEQHEELLFEPYLTPTMAYLYGKGEFAKVETITNSLPQDEQEHLKNLLDKASNPAYYNDPKVEIVTRHTRHKHRHR